MLAYLLIAIKTICLRFCVVLSQAHKLHDHIHDIELSTLDAKTVGEVNIISCW